MASDVNQQSTWSQFMEGLGLIELFLMNTNNINNHSVNLDSHLSDFEPGLVPKWERCYVCWLVLSCHVVLLYALAKQREFHYPLLNDFSWLRYMVCSQLFISPNTTIGT